MKLSASKYLYEKNYKQDYIYSPETKLGVAESNTNLEVTDPSDIEIEKEKKDKKSPQLQIIEESISKIASDVSETAETLNSIKNRIIEHKLRMEKIKNLDKL